MKILVATGKSFAPSAKEKILEITGKEGHELVLLENYTDDDMLKSAIIDADALIVRSDNVTSLLIEAAPKLKVIVRAGAGYDNIDLQACSSKGIVVMNTPGQNSNAVAELVFELMLYHARIGFGGKTGSELRGKTLGIHAFGNVGKYVAEISKGFGMVTYAYDPFVDDEMIFASGIKVCRNAEELYSKCRYISLHLPADNTTLKLIGYDLLSRMPMNAVLINCARKEIIHEEDLLRVFHDRPDFSYLSDVAPDSLPEIEDKYAGRFLFTAKKMGAQTKEANINAAIAAARQIVDFLKTGNQKHRVNN